LVVGELPSAAGSSPCSPFMIGTFVEKKKKKNLSQKTKEKREKKVTNRQKSCFSLISQNPGKNNLSKKKKRKVRKQQLAINDVTLLAINLSFFVAVICDA